MMNFTFKTAIPFKLTIPATSGTTGTTDTDSTALREPKLSCFDCKQSMKSMKNRLYIDCTAPQCCIKVRRHPSIKSWQGLLAVRRANPRAQAWLLRVG